MCAFLYSIAISLTRIINLSIYYRASLRSMPVLYIFILVSLNDRLNRCQLFCKLTYKLYICLSDSAKQFKIGIMKGIKYTIRQVERNDDDNTSPDVDMFILLDRDGYDIAGEYGPLEQWMSYTPHVIERFE